MATIHSPIKEDMINEYNTQIILANNKIWTWGIVSKKWTIYIAEYDFENLSEILRRYIKKGTTGIYFELPAHEYNVLMTRRLNL